MNELDLTTKIEGLKKAIAEHSDFTNNYKSDLAKAEQQLKDLGKIALPPMVFDDIYEAIERGISDFDWSDTDNFDIEYGIEYDGKVQCESHEFINGGDLVDVIVTKVCELFKEADCPGDDQVNTHTVAEKII